MTISIWSKILHKVSNSSFLLIYPVGEGQAVVKNIKSAFAQQGIDPNRIAFLDNRQAGLNHYTCYSHIDIALDTLPLTGGTTTIDAIGMGVPVVTLKGSCLHQRLSHSILHHANLGFLSADTQEDYITIAVDLANNSQKLSRLRQEMRQILSTSPLTDSHSFADKMTNCLLSCQTT